MKPTAAPAPASSSTLRRTLHACSASCSISPLGLNTSLWVLSENHSPAKYDSSRTIATAKLMCSTSAG